MHIKQNGLLNEYFEIVILFKFYYLDFYSDLIVHADTLETDFRMREGKKGVFQENGGFGEK